MTVRSKQRKIAIHNSRGMGQVARGKKVTHPVTMCHTKKQYKLLLRLRSGQVSRWE